MPANQTHRKYFKFLINKGLINPTKNGYRLLSLRKSMETYFGFQFRIIKVTDSVKSTNDMLLGALTLNHFQNRKYAAKQYLEAQQGRVVTKCGSRSIETRLLAGDVTVMFSSRDIGLKLGVSHSTANNIINRLEKNKIIKVRKIVNSFSKKEIKMDKGYVWKCERYLLSNIRFPMSDFLTKKKLPIPS